MEFVAISKKTMRNKDYAAMKKNRTGYRSVSVVTIDEKTNKKVREIIFQTPRGFFYQKNRTPAIEISVTQAQKFFDLYNLKVQTGW